MISKSLTNRIF